MDDPLNKTLVEQTLIFHGLPLIKTWNEEYGANHLSSMGIQATNIIDTSLYNARLKNLSYTDRSKRMKLHNFICSKSSKLFKTFRDDPSDMRIKRLVASGGDVIPPLEYFSNINRDERVSKFFSNMKLGDIVYGIVTQSTKMGIAIKILCTVGSCTCLVSDLNLKGVVTHENLISALDIKNNSRPFMINDYVCCEVLNFGEQYLQLNLGMRSEHERYDNGPPLGLIDFQQLPQFYKIAIEPQNRQKSYNQILKESESFKNPSIVENLLIESGLNHNLYYSFMSKSKFPQDEYAKDLRQQQASKLAFRAVAEGIAHFKEGRHTEAFQCLNKALQIDPRNVEGLVARGALFANSGTFAKAIVDFEAALKINPNHINAKKYLGETLLALGRSHEESGKFEEAQKAYIDCLNINPHHQEALASLNYIKTKINARKIVEPAELELPPLNIGSIPPLKESKRDYHETKSKDESRKKAKKDKKKKGKKRHSSSSESSTESTDSSDSSSESSENSSSSTDSDSNSRSKKKDKKHKSSSPKRELNEYGNYGHNFELDDHELKVKKFLEMGKDEEDYEEKVGQLLAEASKYQKSKQAVEAKQAKKKKKSEKKLKKDKKKRKKEEKTKKVKGNEIEDLREALKMFENLPEKIKKLYQEKMKEEEASKHKDFSAQGTSSAGDDGKWKMKFSKDERQGDTKRPTKGFSLYESDEEDLTRNFQSHPQTQSTTSFASASSSILTDKKKSPTKDIPLTNPIVNKGPVVLDKFGNFRLAEPPQAKQPDASTNRRSRSRRTRSRSDSRSPRRRRSSSYSKRRYSRSYSRSRSRSPNRNNRGFNNRYDNRVQRRYSPNNRVNNRGGRGRWNDNFRNNNRDYRRNDRFDRRPPGNRFNRFDRRSMSRSPVRSPNEKKSSPAIDDKGRNEKDDAVRKTNSGSSLW